MALRFASILLCTLCAVGFGVALPPPPPQPTGQCGLYSEYRKCGSLCAPTCEHPKPRPCPLVCSEGCFCVDGYLKSANGSCVRPEHCEKVPPQIPVQIPNAQMAVAQQQQNEKPKECGANEEYRTCGPFCQPTCHKPHFPMFCSLRCNQGCFCKEGYIRGENGACIPISECRVEVQVLAAMPQEEQEKCGDNEEYRTCGPYCAPTCRRPHSPSCSLRCKKGCFCKDGYLRNQDGKCVPKSQCDESSPVPQAAGIVPLHQVSLKPGSGGLHKFTIPPVQLPVEEAINAPLEKANVEPQCPHADEEYHVCGVQLDCLASCKVPMTPKCMERQCTAGCKCRAPLVRHEDGRCVEKTQCPKTTPF